MAKEELSDEDKYNLDSIRYCVNYLMQHTKKFGIKVNKPSLDPVKPTSQFIAWYLTFEKIYNLTTKNEGVSFERLEQENPEEFYEISNYLINKHQWIQNNIDLHIPVAKKIIKEAESKGYSDVLNIFFTEKENVDDWNK